MKRLLMVLVGALLLGALAWAASPDVTATWGPPQTGSPAVAYQLHVFEEGTLVFATIIPDTFCVVPGATFKPHLHYTAQVAGIDQKDRQGPWSEPSDPYVHDPGPPGACGKPRLFPGVR